MKRIRYKKLFKIILFVRWFCVFTIFCYHVIPVAIYGVATIATNHCGRG
jgi:hypothetical protein